MNQRYILYFYKVAENLVITFFFNTIIYVLCV